MLFSSLEFLLIFLPIVIIIYYSIPSQYRVMRNLLLFVASLFFYAWGEPIYVFLMLFEVIVNYFLALSLEKNKNAKAILALAILIDVGMLVFFKYTNFFIENINILFHSQFSKVDIALPIGISFYTFQILSYIIDVYRKKVSAQKNFLILATYVSLFPQLIAGPIVRYIDVEKEMKERKESIDLFANGLRRLIVGLGKKVILSNQLAMVANILFINADKIELNGFIALLGSIAFTFQIYYDFSGYSDMAIGLGQMFGFHFLENFDYPYISRSVTEFWRRWHMSLGSWFRDYIYIPLGGNRVSKIKWLRNILIVWFLTGFWHGASWNFICWGLYFGILLMMEKLFFGKWLKKLPVLNVILTFTLVNIGFIIFNASDMIQAKEIILLLFTGSYKINFNLLVSLDVLHNWPYLILAVLGATPLVKKIYEQLNGKIFFGILFDCFLLVVLCICVVFLAIGSYNPFLYFRF